MKIRSPTPDFEEIVYLSPDVYEVFCELANDC